MALFKFGKTVKHQRFNYIPRYYDPAKEELQERIRAAKGLGGDDAEAMKQRIRRSIRSKGSTPTQTFRNAARRSNVILIVVLLTLLFVAYYALTRYLPAIEKAVE